MTSYWVILKDLANKKHNAILEALLRKAFLSFMTQFQNKNSTSSLKELSLM